MKTQRKEALAEQTSVEPLLIQKFNIQTPSSLASFPLI